MLPVLDIRHYVIKCNNVDILKCDATLKCRISGIGNIRQYVALLHVA